MVVSTIVWSIVIALCFEFARITQSFDYRSFLRHLLGRGWVIFEILFLAMVLLVIAVLGSASGVLLNEMTGLPLLAGSFLMMAGVAIVALYGSSLVEKVLSVWSIALYIVFASVIILAWVSFGDRITDAINGSSIESGWLFAGFEYAGYNMASIPALLFVARHFESRKESITAGALAGIIGIIPAIFFYISMLGAYPDIINEAIPANFLLNQLDYPVVTLIFRIILLGTFIETGTGFVHGFNERIARHLSENGRTMTSRVRLMVAVTLLLVSFIAANYFGIIDLIASGYGTITWGFWLLFMLPVLTIGLRRILSTRASGVG